MKNWLFYNSKYYSWSVGQVQRGRGKINGESLLAIDDLSV